MRKKRILSDSEIRKIVAGRKLTNSKAIFQLATKLGVSYGRLMEIAGDIFETNKQELMKQLREEYCEGIKAEFGQTPQILIKRHSIEILNDLREICQIIANRHKVTLFFCAKALGDLYPFFSKDGDVFEADGEKYFTINKLMEILGIRWRSSMEKVISQNKISFVKVFSPSQRMFVNYYKISELCQKWLYYKYRLASFKTLSKTAFLNDLKKQKPKDLNDNQLVALAILVLVFDKSGIWLTKTELQQQMVANGFLNSADVFDALVRKEYIRYKNSRTKYSREHRALEISSKSPSILINKEARCIAPDCCGGKIHHVLRDYIFYPQREFADKVKEIFS